MSKYFKKAVLCLAGAAALYGFMIKYQQGLTRNGTAIGLDRQGFGSGACINDPNYLCIKVPKSAGGFDARYPPGQDIGKLKNDPFPHLGVTFIPLVDENNEFLHIAREYMKKTEAAKYGSLKIQ